MKMKNIFIFILLCLLLPWTSQAQELLQNFKTDKITVTQDFKMEIDFAPSHGVLSMRYTLLPDGIVYLNDTYDKMYCYNFDNTLRWQIDEFPYDINPAVFVASTPNGQFIYTYHLTDESEGYNIIWDRNGQMVWKKFYLGHFDIGPSNEYLYSRRDGIGNRTPIAAIEIKTSKIVFEIDHKGRYWNSAASANNKLAVAQNGWLTLYDMATGKELWKRAVEGGHNRIANRAKPHISCRGDVVALQEVIGERGNRSLKNYVYDGVGNLIWDEIQKIVTGKTNGGRIMGISENGKFLAVRDMQESFITEVASGKRIWTSSKKLSRNIRRYTDKLIAFRPTRTMRSSKPVTRIIFLDESGIPKDDITFSQMIDFGKPNMHFNINNVDFASNIPALVLTKGGTKTYVSALNIKTIDAER